ncbi:MAG: hypothetical protein FJW35_13265, partial [Acidobacteria bacterium]|nr:hypothetical protein [Acidobacteriota bacterium]
MNLLGMLRALGDRLGVLETARAQVSRGAVKIQLRTVSLLELAGDIREDQVRLLAEKPPELCQDFDAIFRAAGIQAPAHGWTVERLKHLLQTDLFRNIERVEAQQKLSDLLRGEGVDARELVVRAVEQDRALDEFERSARERLQERARAAERRTSEIAATI